jgi:hypothetical protein
VIAYLSIIVAIVGLLVYAFAPGKAGEAGKIAFACGLLVFLLSVGPATVHLLR